MKRWRNLMTAKRSPTWQIRSREATYLDRQTCSPGTFLYMFWGPEDERKPNLLRVATLGPRVTFRGAKSELPSPRLQKSVRDTDDFCPCTQAPPSERAPAVSSPWGDEQSRTEARRRDPARPESAPPFLRRRSKEANAQRPAGPWPPRSPVRNIQDDPSCPLGTHAPVSSFGTPTVSQNSKHKNAAKMR